MLFRSVLNQFAMDMIARFIDWIKGLLARLFGFGVQQTVASDDNGQRRLTLQPTVIEVEAREVSEPLQLEQRAQQAAQFVDQAAAGLTAGNFDALPGEASGEKSELVQALKNSSANSSAPALAARPGRTASEQPKSGLEQMLKKLEISAAAHKTLFFEHRLEAEKANSHPLQAKLSISKSRLAQLDSADSAWLEAHPIKARLGAQPPNAEAIKALKDQQRATQLELDIALEKQKRQAKAHIELLHEKVLKSQSDLLSAAKNIGNEVTVLTHKSKFHPPLSQLSTELAGLVRPFEDNVQIFTVMPSKDRFQSALGLFEERIPRYQAALKKHPLPVETSAEVDSEAAIVSGAQLESEWEDPDLTRPGFEAPKG